MAINAGWYYSSTLKNIGPDIHHYLVVVRLTIKAMTLSRFPSADRVGLDRATRPLLRKDYSKTLL